MVCNEYAKNTDESVATANLPAINEQKTVVKEMRNAFNKIIKVNKPEKFDARLTTAREHSHALKVYFTVADGVGDYISKALQKFFQEEIIRKLEEQFDVLCEEMITALKPENLDIEGASTHIQKYAPNVSASVIKDLFNDISKASDRKAHVVYKALNKSKVDYDKKNVDEPKKTLTKFVTQIEKKEVDKIKTNQVKYQQFIAGIKNEEAKRFYLTYYSGELKKSIEFSEMFTNFINFAQNVCGVTIEETNDNRKEFLVKIDKDKSLSVDFDELNQFFDTYVDLKGKKIKLDMATGGSVASEHRPAKVIMEVLEDFDEDSYLNKVEGILKKGNVRDFEIPDGKIITFGKDPASDVVILADDIDFK